MLRVLVSSTQLHQTIKQRLAKSLNVDRLDSDTEICIPYLQSPVSSGCNWGVYMTCPDRVTAAASRVMAEVMSKYNLIERDDGASAANDDGRYR